MSANPELTSSLSVTSDTSTFWRWFSANALTLVTRFRTCFDDRTDPTVIGDELVAALCRYCEGLVYEAGFSKDGTFEIAISADGRRERFSSVIRLVESAPQFTGLKIFAFRQRSPSCSISMHGINFSPDDIQCLLVPSEDYPQMFILSLFTSRVDLDPEKHFQALLMLVDSIIGEYDMEIFIDKVDVFEASETEFLDTGLLSRLPFDLDERVKAFVAN